MALLTKNFEVVVSVFYRMVIFWKKILNSVRIKCDCHSLLEKRMITNFAVGRSYDLISFHQNHLRGGSQL